MEGDFFEDLRVNGIMMIKGILQKRNVKPWNWIHLAQYVENLRLL